MWSTKAAPQGSSITITVLFPIKHGNIELILKKNYTKKIFTTSTNIRSNKNNIYQIHFRNNFQHERYYSAITYLKTPKNLLLNFYPDLDAGPSIIKRLICRRYFSKIEIKDMPDNNTLRIYNDTKDLLINQHFAKFPITLSIQNNRKITIHKEMYIIDYLPINLIVGNNILIFNDVNMLLSFPNNTPILRMQNYFIKLGKIYLSNFFRKNYVGIWIWFEPMIMQECIW
jgi:hypothetical protein